MAKNLLVEPYVWQRCEKKILCGQGSAELTGDPSVRLCLVIDITSVSSDRMYPVQMMAIMVCFYHSPCSYPISDELRECMSYQIDPRFSMPQSACMRQPCLKWDIGKQFCESPTQV